MPILSVIIPTHERADYAVRTVRALLDHLPGNVQIVLSDTSVQDRITTALGDDAQDPRLTFVRPERPMSVVEHFNFALSLATGDYLCFIGDDDFVLPELVDIAEWARRTGVEAIRMTFPAYYYWPDFRHKTRDDHYSGTLHLAGFTSAIRDVDAHAAMRDAARHLSTGVRDMPRAYAGLVSGALVRRIVARHGALFGGVSPDIYSAALISAEATRVCEIDYPAIVSGASKASTAGQSASGGHVGALRDNAHIGAFRDLVWDPLIPEFYSVPTVWSFSLMQAAPFVQELHDSAGYGRLYVKCLIWHRAYRRETLAAMKAFRHRKGTARLIAGLARGTIEECRWIAGKLWARAEERLRPQKTPVLRGLEDSGAAIRALDDHNGKGRRSTLLQRLKAQ